MNTLIDFSVPDLGNKLILDFINIDPAIIEDLNDFNEKILDCLNNIVKEQPIQTIINKDKQNQDPIIFYILSEGYLIIKVFPRVKSCLIDFYYTKPQSSQILKKVEEFFGNWFKWQNMTSELLLPRGQISNSIHDDSPNRSMVLRNVRLLHREVSDYQEIRVYETKEFGRTLFLDTHIQISENRIKESDNYTIDLSNGILGPNAPKMNNVLIVGGGDLVISAYLLKNVAEIEKLTVVEIDEKVVQVVRKYFDVDPIVDKEIKSGKLQIVHKCGSEYIQQLIDEGKENSFSGIVIDCTDFIEEEDPEALSSELYTAEFYGGIWRLLEYNGSFTQQITDICYIDTFKETINSLKFNVEIKLMETPEYGGEIPYVICTKYQ